MNDGLLPSSTDGADASERRLTVGRFAQAEPPLRVQPRTGARPASGLSLLGPSVARLSFLRLSHLRLSLVGLSFAALVLSSNAGASPSFPSALRAELEMECTPTCSGTCHTTEPGQSGSADQAFAATLSELGLVPGDEASVAEAVARLADADSDEDGFTDVEELSAEPPSDPNDPNFTPDEPGGGICAAELRYGCGAQYSGHAPAPWGWLLASLGALLFCFRVRPRLSRRRGSPVD